MIQYVGNSDRNKLKFTFKFTSFVLLSVIENVPFCQEDGDGKCCKLDIIIITGELLGTQY